MDNETKVYVKDLLMKYCTNGDMIPTEEFYTYNNLWHVAGFIEGVKVELSYENMCNFVDELLYSLNVTDSPDEQTED